MKIKQKKAPFKMVSPLKKPNLTPAQQAKYDRRMAREQRRVEIMSSLPQSNFSKTKYDTPLQMSEYQKARNNVKTNKSKITLNKYGYKSGGYTQPGLATLNYGI